MQRQVTSIMNVRVWGSTRRLLSTWKLISNIVEDFFFHYFDKWKQFFGINPIPSIPFLLCLSTSDFVASRDRCQKSPTGKVPPFHRVDRYSLISVFPQSNSTNTCHDKIKISNHQPINPTGSSTSRTCQLCNRVFQNAASLNRHSKRVHSYRCEPCDRIFFDESVLQQHLRTVKVHNMNSVSISQDAGMPQRSQNGERMSHCKIHKPLRERSLPKIIETTRQYPRVVQWIDHEEWGTLQHQEVSLPQRLHPLSFPSIGQTYP